MELTQAFLWGGFPSPDPHNLFSPRTVRTWGTDQASPTMAESSKLDLHLHSFSSPLAHLCSVFSRSDFAFINLRFSLILAFFFNPYLLCRAEIE